MVKVTNDFGDRYSGKVGNAGVFATTRGVMYRRAYRKPSNPKTPAQQKVRSSFTDAVDKWHELNSLQAQAYSPLASGQPYSGYNLFVSRWQKMTPVERSAYVKPIFGFKQIGAGAMSEEQSENTVQNTASYDLGTLPIVIGSVGFTKSTGNLDPYIVIDLLRGQVEVIKNISGASTLDYTAGGKTVTNQALGTNLQAGAIVNLPDMELDATGLVFKIATVSSQALAIDITTAVLTVVGAPTYTAGGSIQFKEYTPVLEAKLEFVKANTNTNHFRGYSDANGILKVAVTSEDGNKDGKYYHPDYQDIIIADVSPTNAGKDEYIALSV